MQLKIKDTNIKRRHLFYAFAFVFFAYFAYILPRPLFNDPLSRVVFDKEGKLIGARIAKDGQWRFNTMDSLPQKYISCLVEFEDHRFYYHPGIDPISLTGAIVHNLKSNNRRGGSTIPMQIMRMSFKKNKRNVFSKFKEGVLAVYLSIRYKKSTLLKIYASNAPYGSNVVGFEAACWRYFGKPTNLITWAEAAMLAVLPNSPSLINLAKNREKLKIKRDKLLKRMYEKKYIDELTYNLSIEEPIPNKPLPLPLTASHLADRLTKEYPKMHRFDTTIDSETQDIANEIADYYHGEYSQNYIQNLAILIIDNEEKKVVGYVGNVSKKVKGNAVDMIMAKRSSGSILKPILYCALLDDGMMYPQELMSDYPININGYSPLNFDKTFSGAVKADEAMQRSLNIPFVVKLKEYNTAKFMSKCKKLGISTFRKGPEHYGLSIILGGAEITLWEICNIYSSMARTLTNYVKYQSKYNDNDWKPAMLLNKKEKDKQIKKFDTEYLTAGSIYNCVEVLKNLNRPNEDGLWREFSSSKNIAWKTGTSFGHKDAWAIGFDSKYTVGVWVGNADGSSRANLTGVEIAAPVLFDVFNRLPQRKWFNIPYDDLKKLPICKESGMQAGKNCTTSDTVFVSNSCSNRISCTYHQTINVNEDSTYQVSLDCYDKKIIKKSYFILAPNQSIFYKLLHPWYKDLPNHHPDCISKFDLAEQEKFDIIYPYEGARITITNDITGKAQSIILKANHNSESEKLIWQIDDQYLGTTQKFHTIECKPTKGKHTLYVMDESGNKKIRVFEVK